MNIDDKIAKLELALTVGQLALLCATYRYQQEGKRIRAQWQNIDYIAKHEFFRLTELGYIAIDNEFITIKDKGKQYVEEICK